MFCAYTRSRYQVSVYSTIGPLVLSCYLILFKLAYKEKMHNILDVFEYFTDWKTDNRVTCP